MTFKLCAMANKGLNCMLLKVLNKFDELVCESCRNPSYSLFLPSGHFSPTTMEGLLKIDSLPKKRAELLGDRVLKLISDYCQENNLLSDEVETVQNPQTMFIQVHSARILRLYSYRYILRISRRGFKFVCIGQSKFIWWLFAEF